MKDYEEAVPGSEEDAGRHLTEEDIAETDKMYRKTFGFDDEHPSLFKIDPKEFEDKPDPAEPGSPGTESKETKKEDPIKKTSMFMDEMEAFIFPVTFDNYDNDNQNDLYSEF